MNTIRTSTCIASTLTERFYDKVLDADGVKLFRPNATACTSDIDGGRYLAEYNAAFGGIPLVWQNLFSKFLDGMPYLIKPDILGPTSWGYLECFDWRVPLPFVTKARTVKHPIDGGSTKMTPEQFAVFSATIIFGALSLTLEDRPTFLAPTFIRAVNGQKCEDWYQACMNAVHILAAADKQWSEIVRQVE
jgi:hypothetical protein